MSQSDYSCIEEVKKTVHIALPLSFAGNEVAGIKDALESWKSQYVELLGGILIDYKNVSFLPVGSIMYDLVCTHYNVNATFSVFKPRCGSILKGVVNRISKTHVGCVVHNYINVSIYLSENIAYEVTKFLLLDSEILFQVTHVDAQRRVIRVKGEITPECIKLMEELLPGWNKGKHSFFDDNLIDDQDCPNDKVTTKKSKQHKKKKHSSDDSTSGFESLNLEQASPLPLPTKEHKKKRKREETCDETLDTITEFSNVGNSLIHASTPFEVPRRKFASSAPMTNTSFLDYMASSVSAESLKRRGKGDLPNVYVPVTEAKSSSISCGQVVSAACLPTGLDVTESGKGKTPKKDSPVRKKKKKHKSEDTVSCRKKKGKTNSSKKKDKTNSSKSKQRKSRKDSKLTKIRDKTKLLKSKKLKKDPTKSKDKLKFEKDSNTIDFSAKSKSLESEKNKSESKDEVPKKKHKSSKLKDRTKVKKSKSSKRKSEKKSKKHKHKSEKLKVKEPEVKKNTVKNEI